jgi:hypothetical protein
MNHFPNPFVEPCLAPRPRSRWQRVRSRLRWLADIVVPDPESAVMPRISDYPLVRNR